MQQQFHCTCSLTGRNYPVINLYDLLCFISVAYSTDLTQKSANEQYHSTVKDHSFFTEYFRPKGRKNAYHSRWYRKQNTAQKSSIPQYCRPGQRPPLKVLPYGMVTIADVLHSPYLLVCAVGIKGIFLGHKQWWIQYTLFFLHCHLAKNDI